MKASFRCPNRKEVENHCLLRVLQVKPRLERRGCYACFFMSLLYRMASREKSPVTHCNNLALPGNGRATPFGHDSGIGITTRL